MIDKTMNLSRYIKFGVFGFLTLSLWGVLSIGLNIIPLINIKTIPYDSCVKINTVCLNLSYSYIAGFVIYILTVSIPNQLRKSENNPLIKKLIQDFHARISHDYFMFVVNNADLVLNESEKRFIQDFRLQLDKEYSNPTINYILEQIDNKSRCEMIKDFRLTKTNFIKEIIPLENYLSIKQISILNQIRQSEIPFHFDEYEKLKEVGRDDIDCEIFKVLLKHVDFINQLNDTL